MNGQTGPVGAFPLPKYHAGCGCNAVVEKDVDLPVIPLLPPNWPGSPDDRDEDRGTLPLPPNWPGSPDDRDSPVPWAGPGGAGGGGGSSGFETQWSGTAVIPAGGGGSSGFGGAPAPNQSGSPDDRDETSAERHTRIEREQAAEAALDWSGNQDVVSGGGGGSSGFGGEETSSNDDLGWSDQYVTEW